VSGKPGHTRLINFYVINEDWCLIDLPGYGYAKAPKSERHRFNDFVADYIEFREGLRHVFVLIDCRLEPQKIDIDFVTWLVEREVPFSLVFTKSDKLKSGRLKANQARFLETLGEYVEGVPPVFTTSAKNNDGRLELVRWIGELVRSKE
jgi:GTP-binding protein